MSPRRSSSRTHQPAQRRHRTDKACNFCRISKQRCEPSEYGTNDRPCRRCVSQGADCNLPRAARSQSPSSALGVQGPAPVQYPIAQHSTGGATEELTLDSGTNVQYTLQQQSARSPMGRWSPLMMHSEERRGSGTTRLQTPSFLPLAPSMDGYQQSFPNVAQGPANPESSYYFQDYYGQSTVSQLRYATQSASDGAPNLGYVMEEPQPDNTGVFSNEQDASRSPSGES
ncbi:hypothetical protein J3R83DRAFT_994 [Lanmaoa asiatica]|nr:hypothetical protein J3R83DRAFT_994 [Lanmaoa asiatica]